MSDTEGTVQVVFNGEIYNFRELRRDLESRGHKFRTQSDTEVIVHGYKQWGTEVFNRLNGMFGIAIWDVKQTTPRRGPGCHGNKINILQDRERPVDIWVGNSSGFADSGRKA